MNLVLHLVRKDLIRLRPWLAGWVALLLLPIAAGVLARQLRPTVGLAAGLDFILTWVPVVQAALAYVLAVLLIQEDRLTGSREFWFTRPISRHRLLAAKALGLLTIGAVLPVLVSLPWWLWCRLLGREMVEASLDLLTVFGPTVVVAAFIAVVTDSFGRTLLWSLLVVAVVVLVAGAFLAIQAQVRAGWSVVSTLAGTEPAPAATAMEFAFARAEQTLGIIVVELVVFIVLCFRMRRGGWWMLAPAAVIAASLAMALYWPYGTVSLHEHHAARADGIGLRLDRFEDKGFRPHEVWATFALERSDSPSTVCALLGIAQRWSYASGDSYGNSLQKLPLYLYQSSVALKGIRATVADPETEQAYKRLYERWRTSFSEPFVPPALKASFDLPQSVVRRIHAERPSYRAHVRVGLYRLESIEGPVVAGDWRHQGGVGSRLAQARPREAGIVFVERVRTRAQPLRCRVRASLGLEPVRRNDPTSTLMVVNRKRGEWGNAERLWREDFVATVQGVEITWQTLLAEPARVMRDGRWSIPGDWGRAWMRDASLLAIEAREEAVFVREVRVDRFEFAR